MRRNRKPKQNRKYTELVGRKQRVIPIENQLFFDLWFHESEAVVAIRSAVVAIADQLFHFNHFVRRFQEGDRIFLVLWFDRGYVLLFWVNVVLFWVNVVLFSMDIGLFLVGWNVFFFLVLVIDLFEIDI